MKTFLVVNPQSANGQTGKRWAELSAKISKELGDFGFAFTERAMHAAELSRRAVHDGFECIVAVGGDGTVNEVVNGLFEGGKAINPNVALGLIPRGTGGDFRKTFGWELDLPSALRRLRTDQTRPFDVGRVELVDGEGKPAVRYFANVCSFGVSGLVDKKVNENSKALGGKLSFMLGSLKALVGYEDRKVRFRLDDGPEQEQPITCLSVANGRYFGGGMMVAPTADTSDGVFEVTVWSGYGLKDFVFKQGSIYSGKHVKWPGTTCLRCKKLVATSAEETLIDCDGEQPGKLPCTKEILPGAIRLKV